MRPTHLRTLLAPSLLAAVVSPLVPAAAHAAPPRPGAAHRLDGAALAPLLSAEESAALRDRPADAARLLVTRAAGDRPGRGLATTVERRLDSGHRLVHLAQLHDGLPVIARGASARLDETGRPAHLATRLEPVPPSLPGASVPPALSADDAAQVVEWSLGVPASGDGARLAILPAGPRSRRVWVVHARALAEVGVPYSPIAFVDADSGALVASWNTIAAQNGAKMWTANPVSTPNLVAVTIPAVNGRLQNQRVRSMNCVDMKSIKSLMGIRVHACDLVDSVAPDGSGDFPQMPGADTEPEDPFAQLSMYWHVNRVYNWFRAIDSSLDINGGRPLPTVSNLRVPQGFDVFDKRKLADPDLPLVPYQNAFYSPESPIFSSIYGVAGGTLWFGQGPKRDYSYDGDVVYHEFTHAVVDNTIQLVGSAHWDTWGISVSSGAVNEGLADYFSSALAGDSKVGEYAATDLTSGLDAIRDLENDFVCASTIAGETHNDSQFFSGALWDVRRALPDIDRELFDAAVYQSLLDSPSGDVSYDDMGEQIAAALVQGGYDTLATQLREAFAKRGMLPECRRILDHPGTALMGPKTMHGVWAAPGIQSGIPVGDGWLPGVVQFRRELGNHGGGTVEFSAFDVTQTSSGGIGMLKPYKPILVVRFGDQPIEFTLDTLNPAESVFTVPLEGKKGVYSGKIMVPAGVTVLHAMIGNSGDLAGYYTQVKMEATLEPGPDEPDAGEDPGPPGDPGCSCRAGGRTASSPSLLAVALVLGAALAVRSRRPRRRTR